MKNENKIVLDSILKLLLRIKKQSKNKFKTKPLFKPLLSGTDYKKTTVK